MSSLVLICMQCERDMGKSQEAGSRRSMLGTAIASQAQGRRKQMSRSHNTRRTVARDWEKTARGLHKGRAFDY